MEADFIPKGCAKMDSNPTRAKTSWRRSVANHCHSERGRWRLKGGCGKLIRI